jgi:cleavage and polyadenylation specificity factor subunit 2
MNAKVPLQGTELEIFLEKERFAKEKEVSQQAVTAQTDQRMLEADEDDDDTDSEEEEEQDEVERALGGNMLDLDSDLRGPAVSSRGARKKANRDADADWDVDADEGLSKTMLSFDIYLKGNASRATSFFRSADGRGERFRMFPHVEKKRRVDEYGETVDVGMWLRKGKVLEEADKDDKTEEIQVEDVPKAHQDPPSKFISSQVEVQLACRLLFVDLEGLNDGRAVKTIVPQINPRKMVCCFGADDTTTLMCRTDHCACFQCCSERYD